MKDLRRFELLLRCGYDGTFDDRSWRAMGVLKAVLLFVRAWFLRRTTVAAENLALRVGSKNSAESQPLCGTLREDQNGWFSRLQWLTGDKPGEMGKSFQPSCADMHFRARA